MHLHFQDIQKEEYGTWQNMAEEIWHTTYSDILGNSQIKYMLQKFYSETIFFSILSNKNQILQWIRYKCHPIGFLHGEAIELDGKIFKINKLYIKKEFHGIGLGALCITYLNDIAKKFNSEFLLLHVNKHNSACHFYLKLNFEIKEEAIIDIGKGFVMDDYILTKKII